MVLGTGLQFDPPLSGEVDHVGAFSWYGILPPEDAVALPDGVAQKYVIVFVKRSTKDPENVARHRQVCRRDSRHPLGRSTL